nr:rab3 GTPase-activating protein catalytic subunit [Onthophagus taurus]
MNEEIDESEFYHQDFTTASEWEVFISRLEEIVHEWKIEDVKNLDKGNVNVKWLVKSENVHFSDMEFKLSLYRLMSAIKDAKDDDEDGDKKTKNPIDSNFDFVLEDEDDSNPDKYIYKWYGLNEYMVISPLNNAGITSESIIKILLSSANIAVANLNCEIPMFIQIRDKLQHLYLGVYEGNGIKTNYEMIHLRRGPPYYKYLSGLLDIFKTKIISPVNLDPVMVSVQLTYHLTEFGNYSWKQESLDVFSDNFDSNSLTILPFGVRYDPIACLVLRTKWSHLPENFVVDSENYSDFDPMHAPIWTLSSIMSDQPVCLLAECLNEFLQLLNNNFTIQDILGDYASVPQPENNPLALLTEPQIPTITTMLKRATRNSIIRQRRGVSPLSEETLVPLLYFLFPDASDDVLHPYSEMNPKENVKTTFRDVNNVKTIEDLFNGYKTCANDSLVWRLSITLAQTLDTLGGIRSMAHLWFEFVQEMRYRWDKSVAIPGLSPGFPDPRTNLLHQKLQMLNCCIERKSARESEASKLFESAREEASSSTDDEEFFECNIDDEPVKKKHSYSSWNQPVGRLGKFEDLKLIKTGEPLYIPITQEPVPKTEDQLEEDTDVLLKLGSDAQGSELRAKLMSASLLSDMESFKAANPNSILEDFIRWYSPRDWIEEDGLDEWGQKKGHLSSRMLISDNTWVEIWNNSKPVPAHRQKRLFDDTREAEKVLHFLHSRNVSQIIDLLLPVLSHTAIYRLTEEYQQIHLQDSTGELKQVIKTGERLSRDGKVSKRRCEVLIQEMAALELSVSQINSLLYKFNPSGGEDNDLRGLAENLIKGREVEIADRESSRIGKNMLGMFSDAQKVVNMIVADHEGETRSHSTNSPFPQPFEREFVLRVVAQRPAVYSNKSPQFLRAILSRNEFRLAGAFSEDIVFF